MKIDSIVINNNTYIQVPTKEIRSCNNCEFNKLFVCIGIPCPSLGYKWKLQLEPTDEEIHQATLAHKSLNVNDSFKMGIEWYKQFKGIK